MSLAIDRVAWPAARLGDAVDAVARALGRKVAAAPTPPPAAADAADADLGRWLQAATDPLGLEVEPVELRYGTLDRRLAAGEPLLLPLPGGGEHGGPGARFLVVLGAGRTSLVLLRPDLGRERARRSQVAQVLRASLDDAQAAAVDRLLEAAAVPPRRRAAARAAALAERLGQRRIGDGFRFTLAAGSSPWRQAGAARLYGRLALLALAHTAQYGLWLLAWWMIGRAAFGGRLEGGWLVAWTLVLLTLVPLRLLVSWTSGALSILAGGLLKRRLLAGALRLEPDEIRHQGAGQLLGRVLESEQVEALALSGGFRALLAGIEMVLAAAVLAAGAAGALLPWLLAAWVLATAGLGAVAARQRRLWTRFRMDMTHDLVERIVGHRTRLAQERPEHWHLGEDQALERYLELSRPLDRSGIAILALVPRGWMVLGLAGLAPAFASASATPAALAVAVGGVLLAQQALGKLAAALVHLTGATVAWRQVRPLFDAAARPVVTAAPDLASAASGRHRTPAALEAREVTFRYRDRGEPVLHGIDLTVRRGDRILLEGPSGGGKSTLAALLTGLRRPDSGVVLLDGLDYHTLGADGWRRLAASAPQFHENHVFGATLAFNLLLGRRWPPRPEDLRQAEVVCRELGLGAVLGRMPGRMLQQVGETGWQLSHGERSRLYIARALLQEAPFVVLDESFAALDPETLRQALGCVLSRAATLLVIAHP